MMKQYLLLFVATLLAGTAIAQNYAPDYRFSVGAYGGLSPITRPYKVQYYGSENKSLPTLLGISGNYNIFSMLQVGLDLSMTSAWSSTGSTPLYGSNGNSLGNREISYLYADRSFSTVLRVNGMVPLYDNLRNNRFNFYYGIAAGAIFTVNDGTTGYSQYNDLRGEQYRYVSDYHYEPAAGYTLGAQIGAEVYTRGMIGFNAEFAPRFSHLNTVDTRIGNVNGPYDMFSFPVSVGIRLRFGQGGYRF